MTGINAEQTAQLRATRVAGDKPSGTSNTREPSKHTKSHCRPRGRGIYIRARAHTHTHTHTHIHTHTHTGTAGKAQGTVCTVSKSWNSAPCARVLKLEAQTLQFIPADLTLEISEFISEIRNWKRFLSTEYNFRTKLSEIVTS